MQGPDDCYQLTPFSDCGYMSLHESQSRIWENVLGRNLSFWKPIYPKLQELFPEYQNISLEEFYREPKEVLMAVCGKEADAKPLIKYFKEKYTKLYNL